MRLALGNNAILGELLEDSVALHAHSDIYFDRHCPGSVYRAVGRAYLLFTRAIFGRRNALAAGQEYYQRARALYP